MWVNNKTALTSALTTLGYKEHLNNLEITQLSGIQTKLFVLKPTGINIIDISSNNISETDLVELSVIYFNSDTAKRDANFDLFRQVIEAVKNLTNFAGFTGQASFGQFEEDGNKSIGTVSFNFGYKNC